MDNLNLSDCTEEASVPDAPQNLVATKGEGQVTLTWDAVTNAASYELWAWDSMTFEWSGIGSSLVATIYTHTVETDGRNYYYQVRARDANEQRGAWSERVVAVITSQFSPPPVSLLGLGWVFQKYMEVSGWNVIAPSRVPDGQLIQAGGIITGMLTSRSDLLDYIAAEDVIVQIFGSGGSASKWIIRVAENDPDCSVFVHEVAHLIDYALSEQDTDPSFGSRILNLYQSAMDAGLWSDAYASTNYHEYWAEAVAAHFTGTLPNPVSLTHSTLAAYDPDIAALVVEVFKEGASLPASCFD